jgi:protein subunit release factor B
MNKELLFSVTKKDLEVQVFRAGGAGGQRQNKVSTGVRIIHKDSGAKGESRNERSQYQNKKIAFKRLTENPKFKIWLNQKAYEVSNKINIKKEVEKAMSSENLLVEGKNEKGKWEKIK